MKFLKAVPIVFFVTSGLVSAAPVPFPRADIDAREPIAPFIGIAAGLLPSIIGGIKSLFGRDQADDDLLGELAAIGAILNQRQPAARRSVDTDDLLGELEALALLGSKSGIAARSVEDLDARRIVLPNFKEFIGIAGRIAKGLFGRDLDANEVVKELELLQALASRQSTNDIAARSVEDLDARRIVLPNFKEFIGIAGRIAKGLFGRDVDTDELVKELELIQALSSRQPSSDVVARTIEDIDAREPIAPLIGIAAGLLPSIIGGFKSLFGRDVTDDELAVLGALLNQRSSGVVARTIEDIDAREPIAPLIGIAAGLLPSIIGGFKSLFGRDVTDDELAVLGALLNQRSSDVVARTIEDIDAREPIAPLIGIAAGLLPSIIGGIKSLFGRDVSDDELAVLSALLNQRR